MEYFQQGDCLLKWQNNSSKDKMTINLVVLETDLLHKGDNHHHRVRGNFKILKHENDIYLESSGCELFHEEHNTIEIPMGVYKLSLVQEYDHFKEEARNVID